MLDFYRESEDAVHYALVAERLGVSKFTAYDMLRLLEKKSYVTSEYVLDPQRSGPGRSTVLFRPTEKAQALLHRLAGDTPESADVIDSRSTSMHLGLIAIAAARAAAAGQDADEVVRLVGSGP